MKLQIICRGSKAEGLGHLFRTRTFARAASRLHDVEVVAIVEEELEVLFHELLSSTRFVRHERFAVQPVAAFQPDVLLYDLTTLDNDLFKATKKSALLTASLSPVFNQMACVDLLFTRAEKTSPIDGVKVFAGPKYALFNDHCSPIDDTAYKRSLSLNELPIAVCMGGTDAANKTKIVVNALVGLDSPSTIWVLLGEGYSHSYQELVDTVRADLRHEVILAKTNRSMWRVLSNCAVAILAGGLTTIEAVYAGLPSINLFERREHYGMLCELFEAGVCLNGGLFSEASLRSMIQILRELNQDRSQLRAMRQRTAGLVDNQGPQRILGVIESELLQSTLAVVRQEREQACPAA